jgi:nicotinate (nicotinamide) nucleotide adenylyltransferase
MKVYGIFTNYLNKMKNKIKRKVLQYNSIKRKTRICILSIAGNPITKAHVKVAELILNVAKVDEVHISLDYNHLEKKLESVEHRINMANLAVSNNPRIKISDYQIKHKLGGETYFYLNKIINDKEWENYRFFYAVGMDRANTLLETWYNAEELIKLDVGFVIIPRKGYFRNDKVKWYLQKPHILIEDDEKNMIPEVSSTMARNILKDFIPSREELKKILDEKVIDYIMDNKLYL